MNDVTKTQAFIDGDLKGKEKEQFVELLKQDNELQEELYLHQKFDNALKVEKFRQILDEAFNRYQKKQLRPQKYKWWKAAALFVLIAGAFLFLIL